LRLALRVWWVFYNYAIGGIPKKSKNKNRALFNRQDYGRGY
jgi:hypothetical protein